MGHPQSPRLELAQDADAKTTFVIPVELFGPAFLKVYTWLPADSELDDECIIQVDLYSDRNCTKLIAEDLAWSALSDTDGLFLAIREEQFRREDRARDRKLAALILSKEFDSVFGSVR